MKKAIIIFQLLAFLVLVNIGVSRLSKPSDESVLIGFFEVVISFVLFLKTIKQFI